VGALSRTRLWAVSVILVGVLAGTAHPGMALLQFGGPVPAGGAPSGTAGSLDNVDRGRTGDEPYATREIQERQLKRLRQEHQQELVDDTNRLVKLATALKAEVDKGDQPALPNDVVRQADEISKLAKKVSERIKTQ
jgi:hypothetical protein